MPTAGVAIFGTAVEYLLTVYCTTTHTGTYTGFSAAYLLTSGYLIN